MNNYNQILRITLVQNNFVVGDFEGNVHKILEAYHHAVSKKNDLVVCSELALSGYPIGNLALSNDFQQQNNASLAMLAKATSETGLLIGSIITKADCNKPYNAAVLMQHGKISDIYYKMNLSNDDVCDQARIFTSPQEISLINFNNIPIGIIICADLFDEQIFMQLKSLGAKILIALNASPFELDKQEKIFSLARNRVKQLKVPLIYVNQVGGQDDLIFAGGSFGMNRNCEIIEICPKWEESLKTIRLKNHASQFDFLTIPTLTREEEYYNDFYNALKLGLKDYINKNRFPGVIIGFSGGIDSALTTCIACDAIGKERVKIIMMPSEFTSDNSMNDAQACANLLDLDMRVINIESMIESFSDLLSEPSSHTTIDTSHENIQSRIRGNILMLLSNKSGYIVLSTGNKSEIATGYATLYGDMCGGYNILKDVYKTQIYALAKWRNQLSEAIPMSILTKYPTAELKKDQKDSDMLPEYNVLDKILYGLIEQNMSVNEIHKSTGINIQVIKDISLMLKNSEYKRFQSTLGIKVSSRSFGRNWDYPITNKFVL